jgi:SAM-dependent methyltransferase
MKASALKLANAFAMVWRMIPQRWRFFLLKGMFVLESRDADAGRGLARLFAVQDTLEHVVNERAMVYGQGEHPKHKLTRYHDFFVEHVDDGSRVLDVGCGYGAVARSIARARPNARVIGVDYDKGRLAQAMASDNPLNLSFVEADATKSVPPGPWDIVVLSNVLEHIADRTSFLSALIATTSAKRFLVRVPLFERDWKMPMRRTVGANYYSDPDHKIEPTQTEFREETARAGLAIDELTTPWGEIWAVLRPLERVSR